MNNNYIRYTLFLVILFSQNGFSSVDLKIISLEVAPWASSNKDNNGFLGVLPDLLKEVSHRSKLNIEISLSPVAFSRIDKELQLGRQDCTIVAMTKSREQYVVQGEVILNLPIGIVVHKDVALNSISDMKHLKVSMLKPFSKKEDFSLIHFLNPYYDSRYQDGLQKLKHRRVDAVLGAIPTLLYLSKQEKVDKLLGEPIVLFEVPISLQCSKNSKKLENMNRLNNSIKSIKADGTFYQIMKKYNWIYEFK